MQFEMIVHLSGGLSPNWADTQLSDLQEGWLVIQFELKWLIARQMDTQISTGISQKEHAISLWHNRGAEFSDNNQR